MAPSMLVLSQVAATNTTKVMITRGQRPCQSLVPGPAPLGAAAVRQPPEQEQQQRSSRQAFRSGWTFRFGNLTKA
jgi:hypothetical protein